MSERLTKIGKYVVECVIGEGAMGVVYRAVDPLINRRVAIKVMTDAMAQDTALRERFLREAQAAGSLQHPNLVTIYDFGEIDDHLYIAMEYVEGDDLSELLRKRLPIPVDQALDLVIGLLHGLSFAHKRGIVHRDIKPANIRVDDEGRARLMDFGVAHLASSEMTSTGMLLGTPSYMAPEQITGSPVFPETDIFSVGAVLYELISHHRPFESDTLQSLMYAILYKVPESLDELVPGLPAGLNRVVMKALEKEHQNRYKTALAMANDLAAIRDSIDTSGRRTTTSLRATIDTALAGERKARRRRRRTRRAALSAVGILAAAGLFVAGRQMSRRVEAHQTATMAMANSLSVSRRTVADSMAPGATTSPAATAGQPNTVSVEQNAQLDSRRRSSAADPSTSKLRVNDKTVVAGAVRPPAQTATRAAPTVVPVPNVAARETVAQQSAATQQPVPQQPAPQQPAPQQLPLASPPTVSQLVPAPAAESRESAAAQIATVVAAYARALESRDIDELARVYPSMSSSQRTAFEDFFRSTRSLRATLAVGALQIDGPSADAQLTGSFDYVTSAGVPEHRPVSFRAALRRDGSVWKLVAVR